MAIDFSPALDVLQTKTTSPVTTYGTGSTSGLSGSSVLSSGRFSNLSGLNNLSNSLNLRSAVYQAMPEVTQSAPNTQTSVSQPSVASTSATTNAASASTPQLYGSPSIGYFNTFAEAASAAQKAISLPAGLNSALTSSVQSMKDSARDFTSRTQDNQFNVSTPDILDSNMLDANGGFGELASIRSQLISGLTESLGEDSELSRIRQRAADLEIKRRKKLDEIEANPEGKSQDAIEQEMFDYNKSVEEQLGDLSLQEQALVGRTQEVSDILGTIKQIQELTGDEQVGNFQQDPMTGDIYGFFRSATTGDIIQRMVGNITPEEQQLDTQVVEAGGRKLLVNLQTGEVLRDIGSAETLSSLGGYGGAVDPVVQSWVNRIAVGGASISNVPKELKNSVISALDTQGIQELSDTQRNSLVALQTGAVIADQLFGLVESVGLAESAFGRFTKGPMLGLGALLQTNENATIFNSRRNSVLATIARASGERGVLTDQDIKRADNALPKLTDTKAVAERKLTEFSNLMAEFQDRAINTFTSPAGDIVGGGIDDFSGYSTGGNLFSDL